MQDKPCSTGRWAGPSLRTSAPLAPLCPLLPFFLDFAACSSLCCVRVRSVCAVCVLSVCVLSVLSVCVCVCVCVCVEGGQRGATTQQVQVIVMITLKAVEGVGTKDSRVKIPSQVRMSLWTGGRVGLESMHKTVPTGTKLFKAYRTMQAVLRDTCALQRVCVTSFHNFVTASHGRTFTN